MKKVILSVFIIIIMALPASAQTVEDEYSAQMGKLIAEYDINFDELKEYPFETLWQTVKKELRKSFSEPFKNFYRIAAILLITAFINFFATDNTSQVTKTINCVSVLVMFYGVFETFFKMIQNISDALFDIKNFMMTFLPVFAGVSFASGEFATSAIYTGFFLISIVAVANFCITFIIPSLNLFMAVGVTGELTSVVNLKPLCEFYSKTVKIAMTAAVSVLCFVLSLQTAISQGKDSLVLKAGKLFVTSAVPVIGSSLENAVGSVYASMGVLKGFCGLAGIAVVVSIFVPHILNLAVNWGCYQVAILISALFENKAAEGILSCFREITEIVLSMCVLFMVLLVFSLTVMIKTMGVG